MYILPDDEDSLALLNTLNSSTHVKTKTKKTKVINTTTNNKKVVKPPKKETKTKAKLVVSPPEDLEFDVGVSMATFTMVGVLKSQKHYRQALAVLSRLEEKGADPKRIVSEREALEKLLATE